MAATGTEITARPVTEVRGAQSPAAEVVSRAPRRVVRRVGAGVAGIALAAAAVYAQGFAMPFEQHESALTYKGRVGQAVTTPRFSVKVTSVAAARAVDTRDFAGKVAKVPTSNLFLLVTASATTAREPMMLSGISPPVLFTADGRRYSPTDKVNDTLLLLSKWVQPGFWTSGVLPFEVPKDAIPGARLVFIPPNDATVVDNLAPEAEIDLGLSGEAATRLVDRPEDYHSLVSKS